VCVGGGVFGGTQGTIAAGAGGVWGEKARAGGGGGIRGRGGLQESLQGLVGWVLCSCLRCALSLSMISGGS